MLPFVFDALQYILFKVSLLIVQMQRQTVIEIGEHIGNLLTIPNVPCHAWSACTDMLKSQVGEKWKQGKVTAGLEGDQMSFYSWKPGSVLQQSLKIVI